MNEEVTQEQFYQLLRAKRRANEWRLGGGKHGFRAAQALLPNISKRSKRTPQRAKENVFAHTRTKETRSNE